MDDLCTFRLTSDDGSVLHVGMETLIDNDGPHSETERRGDIALRAGLHPLRIEYYQGVGDEALELGIEAERRDPENEVVRRFLKTLAPAVGSGCSPLPTDGEEPRSRC
jgi:hypothetical protein